VIASLAIDKYDHKHFAGNLQRFTDNCVTRDVTSCTQSVILLLLLVVVLRRCIQKFPEWPPGARTANGTALCH
jgi:hypothetical protein